MHVFDYRGSKVTVDQCPSCDHIFLEAGELARILRDWETGLVLDENSRGALLEFYVEKAAATEGTEHVSLIVFGVIAVVTGVRIAFVWADTTFGFVLTVALALLGSIVAWRMVQARRRTAHAVHLAKIAELVPSGSTPLPAHQPRRRAPAPSASSATPPVIHDAAASYREPAPEKRTGAPKPPLGEPKWPEPRS